MRKGILSIAREIMLNIKYSAVLKGIVPHFYCFTHKKCKNCSSTGDNTGILAFFSNKLQFTYEKQTNYLNS